MKTVTGRTTTISISEKIYNNYDVHPAMRREEKIIIHDGWQWHIGSVKNEEQLKDLLNFLEIEITGIQSQVEYETTGKITYYNLSKNINSPCDGGYWNLEQLEEMSKGEKLKKIKGLSNGSIVDCYIGIGENIINVYRPNPNAKEVYKEMELAQELDYRRNNWYL